MSPIKGHFKTTRNTTGYSWDAGCRPPEHGIRERYRKASTWPTREEFPGILKEVHGQADHENFLLEPDSQKLHGAFTEKSLAIRQAAIDNLHGQLSPETNTF